MRMTTMNTPSNRREFERNFHIAGEMIKEGKMQFSNELVETVNSLLKVRYLPNGRIDFLSVNEMARLHANMSANFSDEMNFRELEEEGD
ncbi:AVAST type 1 anti-phage system protein Avs1c [Bacillus toyonensis]|uniref:AVAST type 1 anti-phage system protein Avs1c n=1 Tax=Bacillus toyonensis TaxID=155322 RepID=UPI003017899D